MGIGGYVPFTDIDNGDQWIGFKRKNMTPIEQITLNVIKNATGIKRIHLHDRLIMSSVVPLLSLNELQIVLAELVALGHVLEIEYTYGDVREFFYIPSPAEVKFRGKGI